MSVVFPIVFYFIHIYTIYQYVNSSFIVTHYCSAFTVTIKLLFGYPAIIAFLIFRMTELRIHIEEGNDSWHFFKINETDKRKDAACLIRMFSAQLTVKVGSQRDDRTLFSLACNIFIRWMGRCAISERSSRRFLMPGRSFSHICPEISVGSLLMDPFVHYIPAMLFMKSQGLSLKITKVV